jgi:HEAT repeats
VSHPLLLVPVVILALASPTQAGLFRKTVKPDPATHVPVLIETLKSSNEEKARAAAASELRDYDAKVFPDILPTLAEALANDPSSTVRAEAAESIGKVRPISLQAGYALEQAIAHDKSIMVRASARWAIAQYRFLGYFVSGKTDLTTLQTAEPPLATSTSTKVTAGGTVLRPTPAPIPVSGPVMPPSGPPLPPNSESLAPKVDPGTSEPPLAEPGKASPILTTRPRTPTPIIVIPPPPREVFIPIPTTPSVGLGPTLMPPKTLPDLTKPVEKPAKPAEEGPTLGPPPPKG